MNPQQLQRWVVRMLFDPGLVEDVYAGRPVSDLDEDSRAYLKAMDRRAWATDPLRKTRTLQALIEECPVSAALAGIDTLDSFFSSTEFHGAIQTRTALVTAFSHWLAPRVGAVAELEGAIARARQKSPRTGHGLYMAVGVAAVSLPPDLLTWWQASSGTLGPQPLCTLLENPPALEPPPEGDRTEHYLLERRADGGISLSHASSALVGLLCAADSPTEAVRLTAIAVELGAEHDDAAELLQDLVEEGLLTLARSPQ